MTFKKNIKLLKWLNLLIFAALVVNGCAINKNNIQFAGSWKYASYSGGYLDRIIVIGKPEQEVNRISYENFIAFELDKQNIMVIPGYTIIPELADITNGNVKQAAVETGVKAILVVKVISVDDKSVIFRQKISSDHSTAADNHVTMGLYLKSATIEKQTNLRLEAGLFDTDSERLLWAATSTSINPDIDTAIKNFSIEIVHGLVKDGFLKQVK